MFKKFLFERYSRRPLIYSERVALFDLTFMMRMVGLMTICVEKPMIDSRCMLEKKFIELISINP